MIEYNLRDVKDYGCWNDIRVFFNTQNHEVNIPIITSDFTLIADENQSGIKPIKVLTGDLKIAPLSVMILVK